MIYGVTNLHGMVILHKRFVASRFYIGSSANRIIKLNASILSLGVTIVFNFDFGIVSNLHLRHN